MPEEKNKSCFEPAAFHKTSVLKVKHKLLKLFFKSIFFLLMFCFFFQVSSGAFWRPADSFLIDSFVIRVWRGISCSALVYMFLLFVSQVLSQPLWTWRQMHPVVEHLPLQLLRQRLPRSHLPQLWACRKKHRSLLDDAFDRAATTCFVLLEFSEWGRCRTSTISQFPPVVFPFVIISEAKLAVHIGE